MSTDFEDQVQTIGKLVIYKNSLTFKNTTYQISNISSMWVADHSYTIKHKFPTWIWVSGLLGGVFVLFCFQQKQYLAVLVGLLMMGLAVYGYRKFKPETPIAKFALGIELNSGRRTLFTAPDSKFVQQAAAALLEALAEKRVNLEKTVINFTEQSVHVERLERSILVGGNISNSLVEIF